MTDYRTRCTNYRTRCTNTAARLLNAARGAKMALSGDHRVGDADAATLTGVSRAYLKQLRQSGDGPRCYWSPVNGSRVSYRIEDLASWVEAGLEERAGVNEG